MGKKYELKRCPRCRKLAGALILRGYPVPEIVPYIEAGLVVAAGCEPPLAGEPVYDRECTKCGHKWEGE